jgi:hypothetical protein
MADPRMPDYVVYAVRERDGAKDVWTRIGTAFKHEKEGVTILFDAHPIDRKVVLMPPREDDRQKS